MQTLQFSTLADIPGLRHAITTRDGGISSGPYASLNLAYHVRDEGELVTENRRRFARELGFSLDKMVTAEQVHGNRVGVVEQDGLEIETENGVTFCQDVDALMTGLPNRPLLIMVADCASVLLVDPEQRVLAVAHAGWRGALGGITGRAAQVMQAEFGCDPTMIRGGIGPCLSLENLEVGEEVAALIAPVWPSGVARCASWTKPHLDLREMILADLEAVGVKRANVEVSPLCPQDNPDLLFSHRGQNGVAGRFGLVAWWERSI